MGRHAAQFGELVTFTRHGETGWPRASQYEDDHGRLYSEAMRYPGYIRLADVCLRALGRRSAEVKDAVQHIDGQDGLLNLGADLDYQGDSAEYAMVGIQPVAASLFIQRIQAMDAAIYQYVREPSQHGFVGRLPTAHEIAWGRAVLHGIGLNVDSPGGLSNPFSGMAEDLDEPFGMMHSVAA